MDFWGRCVYQELKFVKTKMDVEYDQPLCTVINLGTDHFSAHTTYVWSQENKTKKKQKKQQKKKQKRKQQNMEIYKKRHNTNRQLSQGTKKG